MKNVSTNQNEITLILKKSTGNLKNTCETLLPIIYDTLLDIAHTRIQHESNSHTYCQTDLVHEAYFKLIDIEDITWEDRSHFYAVASKCMRQILIDYARKKKADKRGGDNCAITFIGNKMGIQQQSKELLDLDAALNKLESFDERLAAVVECRYFGEMSIDDTAQALEISASTVKRDWAKARGWLYQELKVD